jgi:hypothetical protein
MSYRSIIKVLGGVGAGMGVIFLARRHYLRMGATEAECAGPQPGDGIVSKARVVATRAIEIAAPAERVWPWVAQIGQNRGGFYTYDALENMIGCEMHSADRIVPEWQHPQVGDEIALEPKVALRIVELDPGRYMVLSGHVTMGPMPIPAEFSWAFILTETSDGNTRLLSRARYSPTSPRAVPMVETAEIMSTLMTRGMLRGIRQRVLRELATDGT